MTLNRVIARVRSGDVLGQGQGWVVEGVVEVSRAERGGFGAGTPRIETRYPGNMHGHGPPFLKTPRSMKLNESSSRPSQNYRMTRKSALAKS